MSLPATGASNWGVPLNNYITNVVLAEANSAQTAITNHQTATDPHGDRAYALGLVQPLTNGVNGPNGFLQLNSNGRIPNSTLPTGGGRTSAFDVVKDYQAPTNGTTDASTAIQNALNDCGTAGGGEVWVGDGTYGLGETLYVPSGVWLHLSQGATMQRIVGGGGSAPAYMVANFNGNVSGSGSGNIIIEGGSWVFDSQATAGTPMAFVGGSSVLVRKTSIRTLAQSPAMLFAGCSNCFADEIQFSSATPGSARSAYTSAPPAIRVENATSGVISGLNAAMYTNSPCSSIVVRGCDITGATASDGSGLYTVFGGIAGTTAAVASSFHTNIIVTSNIAVALPANGAYPANWQTCTIIGNQFGITSGTDATPTWSPSAPGATNQVIGNNLAAGPAASTLSAFYSSNSSGRTGTTLTIDPTLQVTVQANTNYEIRASIPFTSALVNLKFDFSMPTGTVAHYTAASTQEGINAATAGTPSVVSSSDSAVQILGVVQVGTTGGTLGLKWAQQSNAPGYPIILTQGAYIYLTPIA